MPSFQLLTMINTFHPMLLENKLYLLLKNASNGIK